MLPIAAKVKGLPAKTNVFLHFALWCHYQQQRRRLILCSDFNISLAFRFFLPLKHERLALVVFFSVFSQEDVSGMFLSFCSRDADELRRPVSLTLTHDRDRQQGLRSGLDRTER